MATHGESDLISHLCNGTLPVGPERSVVMRTASSERTSRALQVAAELGLADALADGPKDRDGLAREVGAHADTLHRLMRALASFGVFDQLPDGRFANTPRSEYLRSDAPGSLRGLARMHGGSALRRTCGELTQALVFWWRIRDSNPGPKDYDSSALTS